MKEKLFKNIIANIALAAAIGLVFALSFSDRFIAAINNNDDSKACSLGDPTKKNISLMIGVYEGAQYIDSILNTLENNGVKATFFVGGIWAVKNEAVLKSIFESGNEIGNYGYLNADHKKLSKKRNSEEILVTQKLIESITGHRTSLFSPPKGSYSKTTLDTAAELGYKTVVASIDTVDLSDQTLMYNRVTKKLSNGSLILFDSTQATKDALDSIIVAIKQKGYNIVAVSQNIL